MKILNKNDIIKRVDKLIMNSPHVAYHFNGYVSIKTQNYIFVPFPMGVEIYTENELKERGFKI